MNEHRHLQLRLSLLGLVCVILQITLVSQLRIAGGIADLVPLVVLAVGLLCGAMSGAVFGFVVGFFLDVALFHTLGISSLLLLTIGYVAGRVRDARDPEGAFVPLFGAAVATLAWVLGYAIIQFLLDVEAPVSGVILRQTLVTTLLNMLLALPVYALVRSWLVPALPADPRRRRRRATTTSLSPLQRAR
ncbi:MAG: rod shape-determining protein MreD [Solirubrobacteraceae bacterium]|nr:rod shape-determining protein MreD [Solirubrobacteraceae bacterium]